MNKNIYSLLLGLAVLNFLTACSHPASQQEEPTSVVAQEAMLSGFSEPISISGNVEGQKTIRLGFMVAGKINKITTEEGEKIKKGALLASLDPESYQLGRNIAKAKYAEVQDEYNRLSAMYNKGSLAESDYVKITSGLEQARSNYQLQEKNLRDTHLYSPVTGVLIRRGVEPGEIIGQGTPVFAISDIDTVQINAAVPEGELANLHLGDSAIVKIPSLNTQYRGKITLIGAAAEPTTRTFTIKIDIPNPELILRPGMIAEVIIPGQTTENLITLNPSAILEDVNNTYYVYVADSEKGKAFRRKVSVGPVTDQQIAILSGINSGEWVITGGQEKLEDGSSITIKQ